MQKLRLHLQLLERFHKFNLTLLLKHYTNDILEIMFENQINFSSQRIPFSSEYSDLLRVLF